MRGTLFVLTVCGLTLGMVTACEREDDQTAILKVLDEGVAGLEERDVARAKKTLSENYKDKLGRSRQTMSQLAFLATQRGPIAISLRDIQVVIDGDAATVTMHALALQSGAELLEAKALKDLLPTRGRDFALTISLAREDGGWKVTAIDGDGVSSGDL